MGATFFFRDLHTLNMIHTIIIPEISGACPKNSEFDENQTRPEIRRDINIWSAGCANGAEPYTLAILLKEIFDERMFSRINIYATDIDPNNRFEGIIGRGSYPEEALRRIPKKSFENSFLPDPKTEGNYIISDTIKKQITYINHDLLSLIPPADKKFDIIICKNVLLHFTEQQRIDVIEMFFRALADGGFFITEQTQKFPEKLSDRFEKIVSNARIYRKIPDSGNER